MEPPSEKTFLSVFELFDSTCSLEREENGLVCERFLSETQDFQKVAPGLPEKFQTPEGFARTFPHRDNMDGFFVAKFCRRRR